MVVLGINTSHDAGAAVVEDGRIVAAVNEERLNRKKSWAGFPEQALALVLKLANVDAKEIDAVAVANIIHRSPPPKRNDFRREGQSNWDLELVELCDRLGIARVLWGTTQGVAFYRWLFRIGAKGKRQWGRHLKAFGCQAPISFVDHHQCHIASVGLSTGWGDALLVSNDGFGDGYCGRVCTLEQGMFRSQSAVPMYHSLGSYYNYITWLCGFPYFYHAGKTMGLAAFGNAEATSAIYAQEFGFDADLGQYVNWGRLFTREIDRLQKKLLGFSKEDIAGGVQQGVEQVLGAYFKALLEKHPNKYIGVAGGIHANVKLNQHIANLEGVDEFVVHPNMGDGGLAVGAALNVWHQKCVREKPQIKISNRLPNVFLGPEFLERDIEKAIENNPGAYTRVRAQQVETEIAKRLAKQKIVARFYGRMEYGPRALGNRSLLYPATDPSVNTWLNKQLNRTEFMPFAPLIRLEDARRFLKDFSDKTKYTAEFMTITYDVTELCKKEAPAAVHIDGTVRPQIVDKQSNPQLHLLLSEYHRLTGASVLINTSFNVHEEPIVCSPREAIICFLKGNIDCLAMGTFVLDRLADNTTNRQALDNG